ncbi:MAG TPA: DUF4836 family protein [Parafilimonas sp.]|nr:DUF4836 family protein [Parafilimonas sp.]
MKHKPLLPVVISVLLFALSSCKQNVPQLALYVPKDAATVFVIDTKAITDKINSSGITMDSIMNMMDKYGSNLHWSDIENSGVDLIKPFFAFNSTTNSMQNGNTENSGVVASLSATGKLESFLQKQLNTPNVKTDTKYKYIDLKDGSVVGWNNNVLILSSVKPNKQERADEALSHQQLTTLFTQSESNSLASISEFKNALNKPGDIHFWSNASGNLNNIPMLGMTKITTLFKDTYTDGTIDFENGKAIATAETHYNKTLSDILNKYPSREIDKSMLSRYPQPINGFGIVAFNPKVLIDILHYLGYDTMADNYTSEMGFSTNDIVNAFSGDIAVIFSDFKMEDKSIPYLPGVQSKTPGGEFLVNAKIGDKAAFNKVIAGLVNKNILTKNGDQYQLGFFGGHDFIIETTNNNLLIASDDALIKTYEASTTNSALTSDVEKEIDDKSMAMYIDIAAMLQKTNSSDTSAVKTMQAARATFKNFIASTDKSDGKSTNANLELNTVNANENSLAALVKFISIAHEENMHKRDKWAAYPPSSNQNETDSSTEQNDSDQNNQ